MKDYINSELCQKCGKCCKVWNIYINYKDEAMRFKYLRSNRIKVKLIKEGIWKVSFYYPCKKLVFKDGIYSCKEYNGLRPDFCKTYPNNIVDQEPEIVQSEAEFCPALKGMLK